MYPSERNLQHLPKNYIFKLICSITNWFTEFKLIFQSNEICLEAKSNKFAPKNRSESAFLHKNVQRAVNKSLNIFRNTYENHQFEKKVNSTNFFIFSINCITTKLGWILKRFAKCFFIKDIAEIGGYDG